jgi:hypothetical protein
MHAEKSQLISKRCTTKCNRNRNCLQNQKMNLLSQMSASKSHSQMKSNKNKQCCTTTATDKLHDNSSSSWVFLMCLSAKVHYKADFIGWLLQVKFTWNLNLWYLLQIFAWALLSFDRLLCSQLKLCLIFLLVQSLSSTTITMRVLSLLCICLFALLLSISAVSAQTYSLQIINNAPYAVNFHSVSHHKDIVPNIYRNFTMSSAQNNESTLE